MLSINNIESDSRFSINEVILKRLFSGDEWRGYEVVTMPVGMIMRSYLGNLISMYDTAAYSYLSGEVYGRDKYIYYVEKLPADFNASEENYRKLINEIQENDYDIRQGAIIINEDNIVMDGQHRCCLVLHMHGPFYRIPVVKCYSGKKHRFRHYVKISYYKIKIFVRCVYEALMRFGKIH